MLKHYLTWQTFFSGGAFFSFVPAARGNVKATLQKPSAPTAVELAEAAEII
jgi:hypothetical protein